MFVPKSRYTGPVRQSILLILFFPASYCSMVVTELIKFSVCPGGVANIYAFQHQGSQNFNREKVKYAQNVES